MTRRPTPHSFLSAAFSFMTTYPTDMHGPSTSARATTGYVAVCGVCHTQWQVQSELRTDAQGCPFCHADKTAISIISEKPDTGNAVIYRGQ